MKTNFLSYFILSFCVVSLFACNPKKYMEEKISETIAEKVIGTAMGTDIETSNLSNADNASSEIDLKVDGTAIIYKSAKPYFTIAKDNGEDIVCSLALAEEGDNTNRTIQIALLGKKSLFKTPLTASITTTDEEGKVKAIFSIVDLVENGMNVTMAKTGTVKVISFSDTEVIIEIDAEGGENTAETHEGKNLKSIKGRIVCKNPMATYMGLKKEEIF